MKFTPRKLRHIMVLTSLSVILTACGGGGGGGGTPGAGGGAGVVPPPSDSRFVVLSWEAPLTREDGSCLDELESYDVSYGLSPGNYENTEVVKVDEIKPSETGRSTECGEVKSYSYMVENLSPASWYFAVRAVDATGQVSDYSNEVIRTVQ